VLATLASTSGANPQDTGPASSERVGFKGFELYELSEGCFDLANGDLDGDGLGDLAVVDNRRSRIVFLRRLPPSSPDSRDASVASAAPDQGPNEILYDGRFELRRRAVERRVLQLALGDWNGDGRADAAWVEDGGELTLAWSGPDWSDPGGGHAREEKRHLDELRAGCALLASADLDQDGREDLVSAGPEALVWLRSRGAEGLAEASLLDPLASAPDEVLVCDLDGDGREDLLYAHLGADDPLRYRLGQGGGAFGPRVDTELPQIRSVFAADLEGDGRDEVLAVFKVSGRLSVLSLSPLAPGRRALLRHTLRKGSARSEIRRAYALGDLDRDGRSEVVVSDPEVAQVAVYSETRGSRTLVSRGFPSLVGVAHPALGDVDGDGRDELVVLSTAERMLGFAKPAPDGTLPFPRTLPIDGEPVALALGRVDGDALDDALVIVAQGEGRNRKQRLEVWSGSPEGLAGPPAAHALDALKKTPFALRAADLDRDGALDALAFLPGEKSVPALLFQRQGSFVADERGEDAPGLGILAGAAPYGVSLADLEGDGSLELLAPAANFVRALSFRADAEGRAIPEVLAQIGAPAPDAALRACLCAEIDGAAPPELALFDERTRELLVGARRADGSLAVGERAAAGRLELVGLQSGDLDGDLRADLVVCGAEEFGVLFAGARESTLTEVASYDPRKEGIWLDRIATADLDGNGAREIVASEVSRHALLVLSAGERELEHTLGFRVFEQKDFSDEAREREPRELVAAELDGDEKCDLALLVHDKLIVYFQE